ncbi:Emopamil binding protein-domain-containing protein [Hypoxylon rubiginosum]|uniref:Emopamil binding protein-domain-containing protein n=1 Tax=Hypoxylon rubiginosum TaxID=110542 RepID=A0ACC0DJ70_9PEZI|nr:Emopamil binding protein-domain-containing protein [Hypoxylon rubiginosum]
MAIPGIMMDSWWWWPSPPTDNNEVHTATPPEPEPEPEPEVEVEVIPEVVVEVPPVEPVVLAPTHPYYPVGVTIPGYEPNEAPVPVLLASLGGMLAFALLGASVIALKVNPKLSKSSLALFCWFVLNGCLHCFFEGYFVFNHATLASSQNVFAQLWKEYALSDSRYLTSNFFMLSIETITTFILGPLCFANAIAIVRGSSSRHALRIVACVAHLYGVALYYGTSLSETYYTGLSHSRPEPLYFWGYYVGFNAPWVIIPLFLLINSVATITVRLGTLDKVHAMLDARPPRHNGTNGFGTNGFTVEPKKTR